ncbi:hypothetical protein HHE014_01200 [Helicobacter heilmannii]|nr:hypothetical protein HHE014_01200 [Helicobacter heilmannii]
MYIRIQPPHLSQVLNSVWHNRALKTFKYFYAFTDRHHFFKK